MMSAKRTTWKVTRFKKDPADAHDALSEIVVAVNELLVGGGVRHARPDVSKRRVDDVLVEGLC